MTRKVHYANCKVPFAVHSGGDGMLTRPATIPEATYTRLESKIMVSHEKAHLASDASSMKCVP